MLPAGVQVADPRRGLGVTETLGAALPDAAFALFVVLTQLGDPWLLVLVAGATYLVADRVTWIDRERAAYVVALTVTAMALTTALKGLFAFPRPPSAPIPGIEPLPTILRAVYVDAANAGGFGFPSGHALGSTVVWGGLALVVERSTPRRRLAVAAALVAVVSLSRLVLGVHYLVDVLAGVALGLLVLLATARLTASGRRPEPAFALATASALGAVAFAGVGLVPVVELASAVGGWFGWRAVADAEGRGGLLRRSLLAVGLGLLGGVVLLTAGATRAAAVVFVAVVSAVAVGVTLPLADDPRRARRPTESR
ncbi:phosphatase PAP2 family protein [Halomarina halobia]|uniref:Phosphatase PAP2 family protein n=1 Tax=Halomarina halobia TaxID=3033386 RepID=A0ABD6ABW4_9EURY|nr:phosphatase PAP2 family protein [Halomarina sp. PSR21]